MHERIIIYIYIYIYILHCALHFQAIANTFEAKLHAICLDQSLNNNMINIEYIKMSLGSNTNSLCQNNPSTGVTIYVNG